nr:hypothetical protein [Tanacetum cinerariifolium]
MQTQTSNTLHNAIMGAGSKDRPPMLAPGNYVQWKSIIKRYIDTKPNHELIYYCLMNPPYELGWKDKEVPTSEGSLITTTERVHETYKNVLQEIRDQLHAEAEAVQIILTGIDNDIYSTVDAFPNASEMWKEIERLNQGESINVEDLETNLYWEFRKFTSRDGESLESYYSRNVGYENQRIGNVAGAKETVEQADWIDDTDDDELEDQELEAHYMYMEKLQEVSTDATDSGPIFDDEPLQKNDDDNDLAKELELIASLIEKLKCETDESKNRFVGVHPMVILFLSAFFSLSTDGPKYHFSGSDQIQTPQYPDVHPQSQEISNEVFQANHSIQNDESFENPSNEIAVSNSNQEKEEPPQDSDMHQLIKECSTEICEEQKQSMEDRMLELDEICQEKEFLCIHDDEQEVKNVVEQPVERGNRNIQSLQNFRVVHKSSISFRNTSQISSIRAVTPILSTKEPEHSLSMGYEQLRFTPEIESDEVTESNAKNLLPIPSECEITLEDKKECDVHISENSPICYDHSDIFSDSKINDDISVYDDDFEDIKYVEASLPDPEIDNIEEENVVQQEEEEVDLEDISQIQDVVLREKLLSKTRLISNIESLNNNPTPDRVFNYFVSDNSLSDNFSPEFETFCDHSEETRSGNTTHADNSLLEYDLFYFEIEPDQERLINLVKNNISNDSLLEEANLFLASDNSIPLGIENFADNPEGDIHFLEELLINDFILFHESSDSNFEDNPSIPRPPPEAPDVETDAGEEIPVVMNDKDVDYSSFSVKVFSFLFTESEDTIFDPSISD